VTWQTTLWTADASDDEFFVGASKRDRKRARKAAKRLAKQQRFLTDLNTGRSLATHRRDAQVLLEGAEEPKLRLIFTDFDGVLNQHSSGAYELRDEQVERLDRLARETGAVVVVSSWWRWIGVGALRRDLAAAGFRGRLIGRTPWLGESEQWDAYERGTEIQAVLAYLGERVQSYVILDDHDRMGDLLPHLVQTTASEGLTEADVQAARAILERTEAPTPRQIVA
jgi:hypothetical protein